MSTISSHWLSATVIDLVTSKAPLPIIADALLDSGCDDGRLLAVLADPFTPKIPDKLAEAVFAARITGRLLRCSWPVYDQHGTHGSGGWSRRAKHRPTPRWETVETQDVRIEGKSIYVNGVRRLKLNIVDAETGEVLRVDYPNK